MIIKMLWALVALNSIALLIFIGAYFVLNSGRNVDYQEKGWTIILSALGLAVILLAAIPLRYSQSTGTLIFSAIFAALPLTITAGVFIDKKLSAFKRNKTFAETYYTNKIQRNIAAAIEQNDMVLLKSAIEGQDVNLRGPKLWDDDEGLTYLQFVVKLRSNPLSYSVNEEANIAAIKILLAKGASPTPALAEGVYYLSLDGIKLLLNAGADPNVRGTVNPSPLLFELIGRRDIKNEVPILLIENGANVNAIKDNIYTPVMYAAQCAGTSKNWQETWRLVRYLLEDRHADYSYTAANGKSLQIIIKNIRQEANQTNTIMPTDFNMIVEWLNERKITTEPTTTLKQVI